MAIKLCTQKFEWARKGKPSGSHFWRFEGTYRGRSFALETDGQFPEARDRALARFREKFGRYARMKMELVP